MSESPSLVPEWPVRATRRAALWWRSLSGHREDPAVLSAQARRFWNEVAPQHAERAQEAHWRGHGVFADDAVWLKLGRDHVDILGSVLRTHGRRLQPRRVIEWGCGGGMNAVHFAAGAQTYHGVDIAPATLQECARQMEAAGHRNFIPVLADPDDPVAALNALDEPCDLFLCTYVFELLPSEQHALQLLDVTHDALASGGVALIQIRLARPGLGGGSRPWSYAQNMAHNVRFSLRAFTRACTDRGLRVLDTVRVDHVPELDERDYAYVVLER